MHVKWGSSPCAVVHGGKLRQTDLIVLMEIMHCGSVHV